MAETKLQLLAEAKKLGLKVDPATKMADIRALIAEATTKKPAAKEVKEAKPSADQAPAKAGKHSAKAIRETEELEAKKTKIEDPEASTKAKPKAMAPRSKLERRSKGYKAVASKIEDGKLYSINEAIELAKTSSPVKFDAAVELHVNLSVDPRQADQNIRDTVTLPAGNGKTLRIAALTDEPAEALKAGADLAGGDDLIGQIDKGKLDFDILIANPSFMPKLGKYAKTLGPKGLMPNPKSGTVATDIKKAIGEAKAGRVEYRVDSAGIVHLAIGKVSFESAGLLNNVMAVISSIKSNKPSSVKSNYMSSVYLATSMGPSISIDPLSLNDISSL
jgi:large subunit ribosomal protein L1